MARSSLINDNSLMQPFFPGTPRGRGKNGEEGKMTRPSDANWREAFPNCKFNRNLPGGEDGVEEVKPLTYQEYLKRKLGISGSES